MSIPPALPAGPAGLTGMTLDADGRVAVDALCVSCGYNLRTLHRASVCPECAHPVIHSIQRYFLRFAPPAWVKGLARGLLLVLIALGGTIVAGPLIALGIGGSFLTSNPATMFAQPTSIIHALAVGQFVVHGVLTGLAIYGLVLLTRREPGLATCSDHGAARRIIHIACWLLPIPIVATLVAALLMPPLPAIAPGGAPPSPLAFFGPSFTTFVTLGYASGALSMVICMAATLALLRYLSGLVRRIPRPGLVRFAQVEFWGLLPSTVLLVVGYAVMAATVLPMMGPLMAAAAATTTAPTTTAPIVTAAISPGGMVRYTYVASGSTSAPPTAAATPPGSQPAGLTLQSLGYATTGPSASMPATAPTMPPIPAPGVSFFAGMIIGGVGSGLGGCGTAGFGVAGIVLLIMSCIAFFHAAREAEQNAALSAAAPTNTTAGPPPPALFGSS
jgi:hypothetical protein